MRSLEFASGCRSPLVLFKGAVFDLFFAGSYYTAVASVRGNIGGRIQNVDLVCGFDRLPHVNRVRYFELLGTLGELGLKQASKIIRQC